MPKILSETIIPSLKQIISTTRSQIMSAVGSLYIPNSSVKQTTGTSASNLMSQDAITKLLNTKKNNTVSFSIRAANLNIDMNGEWQEVPDITFKADSTHPVGTYFLRLAYYMPQTSLISSSAFLEVGYGTSSGALGGVFKIPLIAGLSYMGTNYEVSLGSITNQTLPYKFYIRGPQGVRLGNFTMYFYQN